MPKNSDSEWEKWGKKDPYFGVITSPKYRNSTITEADKTDFFESGSTHVNEVMTYISRHIEQDFKPNRVFDFGCGVGRLAVPFAKISDQVVGVDISESMLKEAAANCKKYSCDNVTLLQSNDQLSNVEGKFDLIHSFIVLQHIPVERGYELFDHMLNMLNAGGICALHFTYAKSSDDGYKSGNDQEVRLQAVKPNLSLPGKVLRLLRRLLTQSGEPEMQMNCYNVNHLLAQIQSRGVTNIHTQYTNHQESLGLFLFFKKNAQ